MDLTDSLVKEFGEVSAEKSPGAMALKGVRQEEAEAKKTRLNREYSSAYGTSDLPNIGPSADTYDYEAAHADGNTFKPDAENGNILKNKFIRPKKQEIAGFDMATGKRFRNTYSDDEGFIEEGVGQLKNSFQSTGKGTPHEDSRALSRVAQGVMAGGGEFDDFSGSVEGNWDENQKAMAWNAAHGANQVLADVETEGQRYADYYQGEELPDDFDQDIDPNVLYENKDWVAAAKVIRKFSEGEDGELNDKELSDYLVERMSAFNWNTASMMSTLYNSLSSDNKENAQALYNAMTIFDNVNFEWADVPRTLKNIAQDPLTYLSLGGGAVATKFAAYGVKQGAKKALLKLAAGMAVDVTFGAAEMAYRDIGIQSVEVRAGKREKLDSGQTVGAAALGGGMVAAIGVPINVAVSETLRGFAKRTFNSVRKKTRNKYSNLNLKMNKVPKKDLPRDPKGRFKK